MIGKTLNHFKVVDHLGRGGMGEVYVAEDSKLKRRVALKVLPEEVSRDPARLDRFQREAEAIAALNHPNIVTIYSIEEADGIRFLTMELVAGKTLIELIPSNGMDVESFVRFSLQISDALSAAHEKGIIHRDLKPGNIMVSQEGRIKVLDFGLAKLMGDQSDADSSRMETHAQTEAGIVLGTMPYMSPEQIQGKRLDHRSDIFSLGIIFYEMLTGRRPFQGSTSAELISAIMRDTPAPVGDLKPGTPEHLERILRRCMMKDPRDRYQTARDVYNELRDLNTSSGSSARPASGSVSGEMWIAVLSFQVPAADSEMENFADGLSQDINAALSQFSYLSVIAPNSTPGLKGQSFDVRAASTQLGARYILQGGIRKSGSLIRVNVQLMDAHTGTNLWAETYNRDVKSSDIFTIQDEITDRVAATLGDNFGVLVRSMIVSLEDKPEDQLSANEFVFRFFGYWAKLTPEEHAKIRTTLENAVQKFPRNADVWACLSIVYANEYYLRLNELPNSLDRCLRAAQRAVELNRTSQIAHEALAWAHFLRRDLTAMPSAIDRAVSLNPRNSNTLATVGGLLVHTRDFERGRKLVLRAMELNPHHAGWFQFPLIWDHCSRSEWEQMLERAKRINMPGLWWVPLVVASACGHLGRKSEAAAAVNELLAIDPEFASHARDHMGPLLSASGLIDSLIEGLQKAGLEISDPVLHLPAGQPQTMPSIAVLPFANMSADAEYEYFCDGLAEELLNALAKIDHLKVAARTSAFSFKGKNTNVSEIGTTLNVKTVLEGSVRKVGNRLRITAQLIHCADGYHLWSERYDREMKDIFDVQDEITLAVVEALKVKLFGEEQGTVLKRHTRNPEAYEFYLQGLFYFNRFTPADFRKAGESFERAISIDPRYASAYAGLADAYTELSFFSFASSETMPKAREAASKALELDDRLAEAHNSLAIIKMYFDWDYAGAEQEFKRALALNPGSAPIHMWYGWYLGLMGRFEESFKEMQIAQELDPLSAVINSGIGIVLHWSRQPDRAIEQFRKVLELNPHYLIAHSFLAEAYEQKGDFVSAIATIEKIQQTEINSLTLSTVGYIYAKSGDRGRALEILNEFVKRSNQEYVPALNFAQIYAGLGDHDKALAWLEKAVNERAVWIPFLKVDLKFDSLRSDPHFQELLKRAGFPS